MKHRVVALRKSFSGTNFELEGYILTVVGKIPALSPAEAKDQIYNEAIRRLEDLPGIEELIVSQPRKRATTRQSNDPVKTRERVAKRGPRGPHKNNEGHRLRVMKSDGRTQEEVQLAFNEKHELLGTDETISLVKQYALNGEPYMGATKLIKKFGRNKFYWWDMRRRALVKLGFKVKVHHNTAEKVEQSSSDAPFRERARPFRTIGVTTNQVQEALTNGVGAHLAPGVRNVLAHRFGIGVTRKSARATGRALNISKFTVDRRLRVGLVQLGLIKEF